MMKKILGFFLLAIFAHSAGAIDNCKSLVVVGMEDERAIAIGEDAEVVAGTANAKRLRERLSQMDVSHIKAVFSFGVAGGLNPALVPGDLLLSTQVFSQSTSDQGSPIEESWMADNNMLVAASIHAAKNPSVKFRKAIFLGTDFEARDNPVVESPETGNKDLRTMTGAETIDNESHIAAKFASEHNLPFLSIRAVSDSVNNPLPPAALLPLDPVDGSPDGKAIAKSLLMHPLQIPALIRTAWEYHKALKALKNFRNTIGFDALTTGSGFQCHP